MGKQDGTGEKPASVDEVVENICGGVKNLAQAFVNSETKTREFAVLVGLLASKVSDEDVIELGLNRADLDKFKPVVEKVEG